MDYILYGLAGVVIVILTVLLIAVIRTIFIKASPLPKPNIGIERKLQIEYAEKLAKLIRIKSIASRTHQQVGPFEEIHEVLKSLFPNVHKTMSITYFEGGSLLCKWSGLDPALEPLVVMAHQDVVPAPIEGWKHDPYSGIIEGDELFGRGTFDTKGTLFAFFQAAEELIISGFVPKADIYLASSSDEEVSGIGAKLTVDYLKAKNVKPKLVLDEGGAIVDGSLPSSKVPIALIGVIEKGYVNLNLIAKSSGGHSSTPPKNSPIARLSAFITQIEKHFPLKTKMIKEVRDLFETAAPSMSFPFRLLFGNLWLFKPLLTWLLPKISPYGRAMLSTTIAYTMMKGSDAENVIPNEATMLLNCRTHPIQNIESTVKVLRKIAKRYHLTIEILEGRDATPIVNTKGDAYQLVIESIKAVFPDVLISPYVILGGTDARHYTEISDAALRFSPVRVANADLKKMHGINESIRIDALAEAVVFYKHLMRQFR
jgi:carboxypeptidase PM20D1